MNLPLFIREYIVIAGFIIIGTFGFYFSFKKRIFLTWGRLLFLVITAACFSKNFFVFAFFLFWLTKLFIPKKTVITRIGYYLLLLPLAPPNIFQHVPFPGLEQLFTLTYPRLLHIFILLPIFMTYTKKPQKSLFSYPLDKYVVLFFLYTFIMGFRDATLTNGFRMGFNWFVDFFILYFVISRAIDESDNFKELFKPMIFVASILAIINIFETLKYWHVYSSIMVNLSEGGRVGYLSRLGHLRAYGSFGDPIVSGTYLAVMMGLIVFLQYLSSKQHKTLLGLLMGLFFVAIFSTMSRGPLIFIALFFFVFFALIRGKALKLIPILFAMGFVFLFLPIADVTMSSLPFIGKKAQNTIEYRKILWANSIKVAKRSPLTGSNTYLEEPEMKELKKYGGKLIGGGIDVVNSYLQILLSHGIIGIAIFVLICVATLSNLWRALFRCNCENTVVLGKVLFSISSALLVTIATVSMISFLPFYFWCIIGLCSGYTSVVSAGVRAKTQNIGNTK